MSNLSEADLRAVAYYAIGVASEGGDVAYKLSIAANPSMGPNGEALLKPIGNSGYTIGVMQIDLGARPKVAAELVDSFQIWAQAHHPDLAMPAAEAAKATADLARDGRRIRDPDYVANNTAFKRLHPNRDIPSNQLPEKGLDIEPALKARVNKYLSSDAGRSFVHVLDVKQVDDLIRLVGIPLQKSSLFQHSSPEDQAKLFGMVAKAYNQGPFYAKGILDDIKHDKLRDLDEVHDRIDTLPDYMRTGRDHALEGVAVFNALRTASKDNSMHAPWQAVIADPLVDPTQVRNDPRQPHLGKQYDTVKGLFVQPQQGAVFVKALEQEGVHRYGNPARQGSRGFHVAGQDFLHWDRNGQGRAFVNGQWCEFSRSELSRVVHKDKSYELQLTHGEQKLPLFHGGKTTSRVVDANQESTPEKTSEVLLNNPLHPGHALYQQAHEGMRQIDASMGRTPDRFTDNAAACLAVAACEAGLTRIDEMGMGDGEGGRQVWVLQGRLGAVLNKTASAPVESFSTPLEQTSAQWAAAQQQADDNWRSAQQRLEEYQRVAQLQNDPTRSVPTMGM